MNSKILFHFRQFSKFHQFTYKFNAKTLNQRRILAKVVLGSSVTVFGYYFYKTKFNNQVHAQQKRENHDVGVFNPNLPNYTLDEVSKHSTMSQGVWVTYKSGVYNITDFIDKHPGGEQILIAAGSSVEPFWLLYAVHENPHVFEILETYRIGNVNPDEVKSLTEDLSDPYRNEPKRSPALKPASAKPFNAELPPNLLIANFITPNELFYVRNHLPVPQIDPQTYELEIEFEGVEKTLKFSLDDLKQMESHTITATIMCAGNRRTDMTKIKPVKGLNWGPAAIGNAKWTGPRLCDILKRAGIKNVEKYKHIHFEGYDLDATGTQYGASIPIWRALDERCDVILAYEMNGVDIPPDHGYPIRVIVPGVAGARNVKWLGKIVLSETESLSHWQQNDYKGFCPTTDWDTVDFTKSPAIQELPVISAICVPLAGSCVQLEDGELVVKGYAWSGNGQKIVRVDVTADEGKTWHVADFDAQENVDPPKHWSWTLWSVRIPIQDGRKEVEIWAKAVDSCYNVQPESFENIWNLRGVLSNAYHRVKVAIKR